MDVTQYFSLDLMDIAAVAPPNRVGDLPKRMSNYEGGVGSGIRKINNGVFSKLGLSVLE